MLPIIERVAKFLERAEILDQGKTVRGYLSGQLITFSLKTSTGVDEAKSTEATVRAHGPTVLRIAFTCDWTGRQIAKGLGVDHVLNHRSFDHMYTVEGAPERVVREMLDEEVRTAIMTLAPEHELPGRLVLSSCKEGYLYQLPYWIEDIKTAKLLLRTMSRIGSAAQRAAHRDPSQLSGYRGEAVIGPGSEEDRREIDQLRLKIVERKALLAKHQREGCLLAIVAVVAFFVLLVAWLQWMERHQKPESSGSAGSK